LETSVMPYRSLRSFAFRALRLPCALLALAGAVAAQNLDLSVVKIEVNQAIQAGNTPLVAGRATWVRTSVRVINPPAPTVPVDGLLRIFVDGVESVDSPVFSDNGPFPAKQQIDPSVEDGTLNFVFVAPQSSNVVLSVEVNPPGPNQVVEANPLNNVASTISLSFGFQQPAELAYVPIDYRPSGGTIPNLPPLEQIAPGMGDNFVQGIFPAPDMIYHRTDAPSKLWTESVASSGSNLLNSLAVDIALMSPVPDFLYGWVNGGLSYNGQSIIGGQVSMGNSELIRFQRTYAHELTHNFGLQHNTLTTGLIGVDVEHQLNLTQLLPQIKSATLKDIMYAGLLTHEAWVASSTYNFFYDHPVFNPGIAADEQAPAAPRLMVTGTWNRSTGELQASDVLTLPSATATPAAEGAPDLVVRAYADGRLLSELPLAITDSADSCRDTDSPAGSPIVGFAARLEPVGGGAVIDRVVVAQAGPLATQTLELLRSPSAPQATFTSPAAALTAPSVQVAWEASDADGDALLFYLRYSPDGGSRFVPLATGITETQVDVDLAQLPRFAEGQGFFELLASDGLNTTVVRTQPLQRGGSYAGVIGNPPWVHIMTPDDDYNWLRGATIVLHGAAWDLEDNGLSGDSLVWTSSVDGPLGTGRVAAVRSLSAGAHLITLAGTDSDGLVTLDTVTINIADRDLPTVGGDVCQADIGFAGPGGSVLTMCGGDLSTGTTAYVQLLNGPSFAATLLLGGMTNAPMPFKGGLLVPVPIAISLPLVTDAAGEFLLEGVTGGGGPATLYVQCAIADAGQPAGVGLSNALQVELLP
jgi:hypothetical protein